MGLSFLVYGMKYGFPSSKEDEEERNL